MNGLVDGWIISLRNGLMID